MGHFLFLVRHSEREGKTGEEEEGPRGGEDEELMISQGVVVGYRGNSCVCFQAAESFYEDASQYDDQLTFDDMNLSRPILKVKLVSLKSEEK